MAEKNLSDFSEDFFLAWELAAEKRLRLTFETKGQAMNFRHRLYAFRRKLKKDSPNMGLAFDSIELSIEHEGEAWVLSTNNSRWRQQIRELAAQRTKEPSNG